MKLNNINDIESKYSNIDLVEKNEVHKGNEVILTQKGSKRNIGNNLVIEKCCCGSKRVVGLKNSLLLVILIELLIAITVIGWILSNNSKFHFTAYIFGSILCILTLYYMFMCFLTEPGIIPRNHPDFKPKINEHDIKGEEEKEKGITPSIFKSKVCLTCNILRPPRTSHCSECDNCIQNFDHHCIFISNCVGIRNHKYFFLFLLYGTILAIYVFIFDLIHVLYVLFFYPKFNIVKEIFKKSKVCFFLSLIFFILTLIYASIGIQDIGLIILPFSVGYIIFIINFYIYTPNEHLSWNYNPFSIAILGLAIALGIFASSTFFRQLHNIMSGFTVKQMHSIKKEYTQHYNEEEQLNADYFRKKTCKEKIQNLRNFISNPIIPSLIDYNRDIYNFNTIID